MIGLAVKTLRFLRQAGPAWALAVAFVALLGYASYLQVTDARAASHEDLEALKERVSENELRDAKMHTMVSTKLESVVEEIKGLRADFRVLISRDR